MSKRKKGKKQVAEKLKNKKKKAKELIKLSAGLRVDKKSNYLTKEQIVEALPYDIEVPDKAVEDINKVLGSGDLGDVQKEAFVTHSKVLKNRKIRNINTYLNAIRFVTLYSTGRDAVSSWKIVFPEKYKKARKKAKGNRGKLDRVLNRNAKAYAASGLIQDINYQAAIPLWLMNQHLAQESITGLSDIAKNDKYSPNARVLAYSAILTNTKVPDQRVTYKDEEAQEQEDDSLTKFKDLMVQINEAQQRALSTGLTNVKNIGEGSFTKIIENDKGNE